jgi:NAD(P)H-hydrate epimerase
LEPDTTLVSSKQMYQIENNGEVIFRMKKALMMENAGHGLADHILSEMGSSLERKEIVSFCGTGNNGGDAIVASRHLSGYYGANVTVIVLGELMDIKTEEARINFNIIKRMKSIRLFYGEKALENAGKQIAKGHIIIDGIFGTGVKGNIRDPHSSAIEIINASNAYVVSVDIPSGLDPDTGATHEKCVKANATVTFHRIKKGLIGKQDYTGKVYLERIGIPIEAEEGVL